MPWPTNPSSRTSQSSVHYGARKLGELATIESGGTPRRSNPTYFDGDIPFVKIEDMLKDPITETGEKITRRGLESSAAKIWKRGTILFSIFATLGRVSELGINAASNQAIAGIFNIKPEVEQRYLKYFLGKIGPILALRGRGVAQSNLNLSILKKLEIPLPPLKIQKQIVERLDKIAEAQKLNDGLIQKTDELFQSLLHQELNPAGKNWKVKKLKEVCKELFAGGDVPKNNFSKIKTEKYFVPIFANGIQGKDLYGYTDIKKVTKPSITISARGTIGYPAIRTEAFYPIVRLIVLIPNSKIIDLHFLYYTTRNFNFFNTGTSIPQLTIPMIKNIKIPLPLFKTQKQIAAKLSAVQEYKTQLLAQRAKLRELFDSALHKSMKNE